MKQKIDLVQKGWSNILYLNISSELSPFLNFFLFFKFMKTILHPRLGTARRIKNQKPVGSLYVKKIIEFRIF